MKDGDTDKGHTAWNKRHTKRVDAACDKLEASWASAIEAAEKAGQAEIAEKARAGRKEPG